MSTTSYASPATVEAPELHTDAASPYQRLSDLPVELMLPEALKLLRYELDLPVFERRRHVVERMRSWLQLSPAEARRLAAGFADAAAVLDPAEREELRQTEEDAVMDGLSYAEFRRLAAFVPSLGRWRSRVASLEETDRSRPGCLAAALAILSSTV